MRLRTAAGSPPDSAAGARSGMRGNQACRYVSGFGMQFTGSTGGLIERVRAVRDGMRAGFHARCRPGRGSLAELALADFVETLAVDAQCGRRSGLEASNADFRAAGVAKTVFITIDTGDGFIDLANQLALPVARAQLETEFGLL